MFPSSNTRRVSVRSQVVRYRLVGNPTDTGAPSDEHSASSTKWVFLCVFPLALVAAWVVFGTNDTNDTTDHNACTTSMPCVCYVLTNDCNKTTYAVLMPEGDDYPQTRHKPMLDLWRSVTGSQAHQVGSNAVTWRIPIENGQTYKLCANVPESFPQIVDKSTTTIPKTMNSNLYFALGCLAPTSPPPYYQGSTQYKSGKLHDWVGKCNENADNNDGPKYEMHFQRNGNGRGWEIYFDGSIIDGMHNYSYVTEISAPAENQWTHHDGEKLDTIVPLRCNGARIIQDCTHTRSHATDGATICKSPLKKCDERNCSNNNMCKSYDFDLTPAQDRCTVHKDEYAMPAAHGCFGCNTSENQIPNNYCTNRGFCQDVKCEAGPVKRTQYYRAALKHCPGHYNYAYGDLALIHLQTTAQLPSIAIAVNFSCPSALTEWESGNASYPESWKGPDEAVNQSCGRV
jgi:hypothetical protein